MPEDSARYTLRAHADPSLNWRFHYVYLCYPAILSGRGPHVDSIPLASGGHHNSGRPPPGTPAPARTIPEPSPHTAHPLQETETPLPGLDGSDACVTIAKNRWIVKP